MRFFFLFIFLMSLSAQSTYAATVNTFGDLRYDVDTKIIDHADPLVWRQYLGFEVLQGLSYQEVVSATSTGSLYQDYSIATLTDAQTFVSALFPGGTPCTGVLTDSTVCGDGWVTGHFGGDPRSLFDSFWFVDDVLNPVNAGLIGFNGDGFKRMGGEDGEIILFPHFGTIAESNERIEELRFTCDYVSWLVYKDHKVGGDSGSIPEPASIVLLSIGLLGYSYHRKRVY